MLLAYFAARVCTSRVLGTSVIRSAPPLPKSCWLHSHPFSSSTMVNAKQTLKIAFLICDEPKEETLKKHGGFHE